MSKTAIIRFKPLEPYFFGGENTHGSPGAEAQYYAKGNPYPQQTTLLGTIRNMLRLANYPFGIKSFHPALPDQTDFGHLIRLSPLFLQKGEGDSAQHFLRQAIDRHTSQPFSIDVKQEEEWLLFDGDTAFRAAAEWQNYQPKESLADAWVSSNEESISSDALFYPYTRPGIPKRELHKPQVNGPGFFKQELTRLASEWSFAVLAELDDAVDIALLNGASVLMGGENSVFHVSAEVTTQTFQDLFPPEKMFYPADHQRDLYQLVLLSDTDIPEKAWAYVCAAVTETTDFRHLHTHTSLNQIGKMARLRAHSDSVTQTDPLAKSAKYTLLRRGSVLVCATASDLEELTKALTVAPWHPVGFNHFFTYQPTQTAKNGK